VINRYRAFICIFTLLLISLATASAQNPFNYDTQLIMQEIRSPHPDLTMISAHRGIHSIFGQTTPNNTPENSFAAISAAAAFGAEVIELDIRLTSDGVPILMHDSTLGGKTNITLANQSPNLPSNLYNPFTNVGFNPNINGLTMNQIDSWPDGQFPGSFRPILLRDAVNFVVSTENVHTLQEALNFINGQKIAAVIALDIKDAASAQAAWAVVASNTDYLGRPYAQSVLFKINASAFPTVASFQAAFSGISFPDVLNPDGTQAHDYNLIRYWPVYSTSAISANQFGGEQAIIDSILDFQKAGIGVLTEINLKQDGGILAPVLAQTQVINGKPIRVGNFNPVAEWIDPNDSTQTPQFYSTDGSCCVKLSSFFQPPTPTDDGVLEDTEDNRPDINFIINNGFNMITTDNVVTTEQLLSSLGKRNTCYIRTGCTQNTSPTPPCGQGVQCVSPAPPCGTGVQCIAPDPNAPPNNLSVTSSSPVPGQRIAYYTSWSVYANAFYPKALDTQGIASKLTTLNYAFENIDPVNLTCFAGIHPASTDTSSPTAYDGASDAYADYQMGFTSANSVDGSTDQWGQPLEGNFNQLKELKAKYPNLKVLLTLGGWTYSKFFSDVAATDASRKKFVSSCINLYINGNLPVLSTSPAGGQGVAAGIFDGFDIDWEYPASPNGNVGNHYSAADTANYTALLAEFRAELNALGGSKHYMLTAAVPAGPTEINSLQIPQLAQYLDYADVMTYDFHGAFETNGPTNFQAPLFDSPLSPAVGTGFTVNNAINSWLNNGFPANKLNLGIAFYGRGWTGVPNNGANGLYQSVTGATAPFPFSQEAGVVDYKELETAGKLNNNVYFDPTSDSAWVYDGTNFYGLDVPYSLQYKLAFMQQKGLAGVMMYSLEDDDASSTLLNAATGLGTTNGSFTPAGAAPQQ